MQIQDRQFPPTPPRLLVDTGQTLVRRDDGERMNWSGVTCRRRHRTAVSDPPGNAEHLISWIKVSYLRQADPTGDFVGDVLPVDVSYPGAGGVLHAAATHPHLQRRRERERERDIQRR